MNWLEALPNMMPLKHLKTLEEKNCDIYNIPFFFNILLEVTKHLVCEIQKLQQQLVHGMISNKTCNSIEVKNIKTHGKHLHHTATFPKKWAN